MPLLVFTTNLDKIRSRDPRNWKRQTIRFNADYWEQVWRRHHLAPRCLHVWLGSPRASPEAEKWGLANFTHFEKREGESLTQWDAIRDGFPTLAELAQVLTRMHKLTLDQYLEHTWALITFSFPDDPIPESRGSKLLALGTKPAG